MIKEYCDRCKVEIIKERKKNISFDCQENFIIGLSGKVDIIVCLKCHKEIKDFATKTIPYRGKVWIRAGRAGNQPKTNPSDKPPKGAKY